MQNDRAKGGARCDRPDPAPGSPWAATERAVTRAEGVATDTGEEAIREFDAAYDALFTTAVAEDVAPEEWARVLTGFMDRVGAAWVRLCRALERVHERRIAALDARFAATLAGALAAVREARYAEELAALERLHVCELALAEVELQARTPDWSDELWHEVQTASLETLGSELQAERDRLTVLERRAGRGAPDPRGISELRSTRARVRCWETTLARQRNTFAGLPRTPEEADEVVARAREDMNAARAAAGALNGDEHNFLTQPGLAEVIEHSRQHPEQRRGRPARP